jgi:hypothetical protein
LKEEDYPKIQKELGSLIAALEGGPNPDGLPLDIPVEKVKMLKSKLVYKEETSFHQQSSWEKLKDGWWVGLGFALAAGAVGGIWYLIKMLGGGGGGGASGSGTAQESSFPETSTAPDLSFECLPEEEWGVPVSVPLEDPVYAYDYDDLGCDPIDNDCDTAVDEGPCPEGMVCTSPLEGIGWSAVAVVAAAATVVLVADDVTGVGLADDPAAAATGSAAVYAFSQAAAAF